MADGIVAPFPAVAPGGIRTATESVVAARHNLEKARVALGEERKKKVAEKIDAFVAAAKNAVSPADALRTQTDLDVLKKTFDDQEKAVDFWDNELASRLKGLAEKAGPEVVAVLNSQIAALRQQLAEEQGEVDNTALRIAEYEALIASIERRHNATAKQGGSRQASQSTATNQTQAASRQTSQSTAKNQAPPSSPPVRGRRRPRRTR